MHAVNVLTRIPVRVVSPPRQKRLLLPSRPSRRRGKNQRQSNLYWNRVFLLKSTMNRRPNLLSAIIAGINLKATPYRAFLPLTSTQMRRLRIGSPVKATTLTRILSVRTSASCFHCAVLRMATIWVKSKGMVPLLLGPRTVMPFKENLIHYEIQTKLALRFIRSRMPVMC